MPPVTDRLFATLRRPLTTFQTVLGWAVATATFFVLVQFIGGPVESDSAQSIYSTFLVQHGYLSCIYPPPVHFHFPMVADPYAFVAPFWPLLSGGLAAILRIGHTAPFPNPGVNCATATPAIYRWMGQSTAALDTIRLGYVAWVFLAGGVVAYLRSLGRGKTLWEPFALLILAVTPSVWMPITQFYHPQDIVAMGLSLVGLALVRRDRWLWGGVVLGLAFTAQQFAVLPIALVLVLAARAKYPKLIGGLAIGVGVIALPLLVFTSGHALHTIILGSSRNISHTFGGTVIWEAHLRGPLRFVVSRMLPVIAVMLVTWAAKRRWGHRVFSPVIFSSLVALSLVMRLVFEINLFGYYFMAAAVTLVLLDVTRGRLRGGTVVWLLTTAVAFNPIPFGFVSNDNSPLNVTLYRGLPFAVLIVMALVVVVGVVRHRLRWVWLVGIILAIPVEWQMSTRKYFGESSIPHWAWQIVLVSWALALIVTALRAEDSEDDLGAQPLGVPLGLAGDTGSRLTEGATSRPE